MTHPVAEPFDLEVLPGKKVRDLASREECQRAMFAIDMALETIAGQIAQAEADPLSREPGWRTRAQSAIRWKKRIKTAIYDFSRRFEPVPTPTGTRRKLLLDVIKDDLGADEFDRLVGVAKRLHPEAFRG